MKVIGYYFLTIACLFISISARAGNDSNYAGEVEGFYVYTDGDYIYFRLKNQPQTHPGCNPKYFVVSEDVPQERRRALLARLSIAYSLKEPVNIGYDGQGNCVHGYIRVHRIG